MYLHNADLSHYPLASNGSNNAHFCNAYSAVLRPASSAAAEHYAGLTVFPACAGVLQQCGNGSQLGCL